MAATYRALCSKRTNLTLVLFSLLGACDRAPTPPQGPAIPAVAKVASIAITPASPTLLPGERLTVLVEVFDQTGHPFASTVSLTSSDTMVVAIDGTRTLRGGMPGRAEVIATAGDVTAKTSVTVDGERVARIVIALPDTVRYGVTVRPAVSLLGASGTVLTGRRQVMTVASEAAVQRTSDGAGIVTPRGEQAVRTMTVVVESEGSSASKLVTLSPPPAASLAIVFGAPALFVDSSTTLTALAKDSLGDAVDNARIQWSVSGSAAAQLTGRVLRALLPGSATVRARVDALSAVRSITTYANIPFRISVVADGVVAPALLAMARTAARRWEQLVWHSVTTPVTLPTNRGCSNHDIVSSSEFILLVQGIDSAEAHGAAGFGGPCLTETLPGGGNISRIGRVIINREWAAATDSSVLLPVLLHEIAHALGSGTISIERSLGLSKRLPPDTLNGDPYFAGVLATAAWTAVSRSAWTLTPGVPLAGREWMGSAWAHWRPKVFNDELMNYAAGPKSRISRVTVAQLADLGYGSRPEFADDWSPNLAAGATNLRGAPEVDLREDVLLLGNTIRDAVSRRAGIGNTNSLRARPPAPRQEK